ncbi:MAG: TIR domain-containing protein [Blastocatellia bacterium]
MVFISYAREDWERIEPLVGRLNAAGYDTWIDRRNILAGENWDASIARAVRSADFFLAFLSTHSVGRRSYLRREIKQALRQFEMERLGFDIYLIPVRLDPCKIPEELSQFQSVDLFESDGVTKLLDALRVGRARLEDYEARLLERCTDVITIANAHRGIASTHFDDTINSLLRSFNRISQGVDAALHQESAYNQRLALTAVEDSLDKLLRELTYGREGDSLRFRPIAASWRQIIAGKVRELAKTVEERQEIDSPYVIGVPLMEQQEIFVGRADVSARIEPLLLDRRRPPLLLYGQRRMGKTSLLNNLGRLLPSTIVPLFVDLQGAVVANSQAGLLYGIARGMAVSAERQRALILPALSRESLADDPFARFNEWLDEVEKALDTNTALLTLDEFEVLFDALAKGRFSETDVLGMLRHLIQHRPKFKVLLAGSHTLDEFRRWASYLINVQVIKLGYLKEKEALQLIERPVPDFALRYEPDASRRVLNLTRGHPYLVQQLCAEIVALKNEQDPAVRRLARLPDVEAAIPEALTQGHFFYSDIELNQVDSTGAELLRFIAARGEGAIISQSELTRQFDDEFEPTLDLLLRRDLIEPVNGGFRFQVEMIRRWFVKPTLRDEATGIAKSFSDRVTSQVLES